MKKTQKAKDKPTGTTSKKRETRNVLTPEDVVNRTPGQCALDEKIISVCSKAENVVAETRSVNGDYNHAKNKNGTLEHGIYMKPDTHLLPEVQHQQGLAVANRIKEFYLWDSRQRQCVIVRPLDANSKEWKKENQFVSRSGDVILKKMIPDNMPPGTVLIKPWTAIILRQRALEMASLLESAKKARPSAEVLSHGGRRLTMSPGDASRIIPNENESLSSRDNLPTQTTTKKSEMKNYFTEEAIAHRTLEQRVADTKIVAGTLRANIPLNVSRSTKYQHDNDGSTLTHAIYIRPDTNLLPERQYKQGQEILARLKEAYELHPTSIKCIIVKPLNADSKEWKTQNRFVDQSGEVVLEKMIPDEMPSGTVLIKTNTAIQLKQKILGMELLLEAHDVRVSHHAVLPENVLISSSSQIPASAAPAVTVNTTTQDTETKKGSSASSGIGSSSAFFNGRRRSVAELTRENNTADEELNRKKRRIETLLEELKVIEQQAEAKLEHELGLKREQINILDAEERELLRRVEELKKSMNTQATPTSKAFSKK
ncbi:MAG: hypothetical protein JSS53_01125 [Proteobacteria bacterium]|nr:hypothetical protein [Pseudomonadota bacterium]